MSRRSALALALLLGTMVSAGGVAGERPEIPGGSPRAVISPGSGPDLSLGLESTKPRWPRNEVKITVTVKNIGDARAPLADCRVIIRQAHAPRQVIRTIRKAVRALDAGDKYSFTFPLKVGLGLFEVAARIDPKNRIAETDETNNDARIMITGE